MDKGPSPSLIAHLRAELARVPPFSQMSTDAIEFFITRGEQRYFAPEETLLSPQSGQVRELFYLRQGAVAANRTSDRTAELGAFEYEPGDLFPVSAVAGQRAVSSTYRAVTDAFALAVPIEAVNELANRSKPFADFLHGRIPSLLKLSRLEQQWTQSSAALSEQSFETPLGQLTHRTPVTCRPDTPLREALGLMHAQHIGSILVTDPAGRPEGILTRHDVLGLIVLPGTDLDRPIREVMISPVRCLTHANTVQDAALMMAQHGIQHIPVTRDDVVISLVSERDLFALQRQSIKDISSTIRRSHDVAALTVAAQHIRRFAGTLLGQGIQARQLTSLISHLNDLLTERLLQIEAKRLDVDLSTLCWLALGSEGRSEQTIATDQDNALMLPDDASQELRSQTIKLARSVNQALDTCGYPLCKGNIMAGSPGGAMTLSEWRARFSGWISHGAPEDLLSASIYFDFRCLTGNAALAETLRAEVVAAAQRTPRFLKQLALNSLQSRAALNWLGGLDADREGMIDLKMRGAAIFVDAARLYSLANGLTVTSTRERLVSAGRAMGLAESEYESWVGGFEFIQGLRLRTQLQRSQAQHPGGHPNQIALSSLSDIDRRILKESLRVARALQQRLQLDYLR